MSSIQSSVLPLISGTRFCSSGKLEGEYKVWHYSSSAGQLMEIVYFHGKEVEKVDNSRQYALEKPDECPVCLEKLSDEEKPWPCGHYVHRTCITRSFKAECPLCRSKLSLLPAEEREIRARANR
jgi:hypothetical protein